MPFEESEILTNENHRSVLKGWLSSQKGIWRLLFRASRDGFTAAAFHSKCDKKGPTVTIVKSENNIFGGFTKESWTSPGRGEYKTCKDAFLFTMENQYFPKPTKIPLKTQQEKHAIYCDSGCGPVFGIGSDLSISSNVNTSYPSNLNHLNNTYECPPGQQATSFTGNAYFTVTDYEVFELHTNTTTNTDQTSKPAMPFEESEILTNENHRSVLKGWLSSQEGKWRLLFRASRDGFTAAAFHSKCDKKGPTVTIVKSGNNIFGGFTEEPWTSPDQEEYKTCRDAFLFTMVNQYFLKPTKMRLKTGQQQQIIFCHSGYGPVFGFVSDLFISNNANKHPSSHSLLDCTYQCPPGQQATFFTGNAYFTVTDYEVFGLHTNTTTNTDQTSNPAMPFEESKILMNENHRSVLKGWLPSQEGKIWRLLFRASRDGFTAAAFHSKCDDQGPTVTIVKSGNNIFGGFTEESWTNPDLAEYKTCRDAFLFSMVNPCGLGPTKMPLKTPPHQHAIFCHSRCGPVFGVVSDLSISSNANTGDSSHSLLNNTYKCPPGQEATFFTGSADFTVTDYEVFELHTNTLTNTDQTGNPAMPFEESEILTSENHRSVLKGWLSSQKGKWRLLFRASRDGFAAAVFHSKCDDKGPTVTIVKSGDNIFGGFTEESWRSAGLGEYEACRDAFLFSMGNRHGLGPTTMPLKTEPHQHAIFCNSRCGPEFGFGADLSISNNANTGDSSHSRLGDTYECPPGRQATFFTGNAYFTVTDYEVFGLHT